MPSTRTSLQTLTGSLGFLLFLLLPIGNIFAFDLPTFDVASALQKEGPIRLTGPWALYRCQMLRPGWNQAEPYTPVQTGVSWQVVSDERCGGTRDSFGYGSYAIRLKGFPKRSDGYQIRLKLAFSAYRMFVYPEHEADRMVEIESGRVSEQEALMLPAYQTRFLPIQPQHPEEAWIVLIQISNFQHHRGGLIQPPMLDVGRELEREFHQEIESTLVCLGLMGFMMVYTLMLYLRRKEDQSSLLLSITCLMFIVRLIPTSNLLYYYIPNPPAWLFRIHFSMEYSSLVGCVTAYLLFVHFSFRKQSPQRWVTAFTACGLILSLVPLVAPIIVFTSMLPISQIFISLQMLCAITILTRAVRRKQEGAWLAVCGDLTLAAFALYDMAMSTNLLPRTVYMTQYGACFFLFMQSQLVASRFAKAFRTAERLQQELQSEVDRQTEEISSMMKNIPQGVFVILSDQTIQGNYSSHLEVILGQRQLSGKPALSTLFASSSLTQEQMDLASSALVASLSEDILVWNLNADNLPREILRRSQDSERILELDWNPIVNREERMDRVLVTVRDVTQVRALQEASRRQKSEFDMILEIMQADRRTIVNFFELGSQLLKEIQAILVQTNVARSESGRQAFLKLHTLKGLARSYGLSRLTASIHDAEQQLVQHQRAEWVAWEPQQFQPSIISIQKVFEGYWQLLKDKLGWKQEARSGREFTLNELLALEKHLRLATARPVEANPEWNGLIRTVQDLLDRHLFIDLQELLLAFDNDLRSLAAELDKPRPRLILKGEPLRLSSSIENLLRGSLLHLIRNSMDHGLESMMERQQRGKPGEGQITIETGMKGSIFEIIFQDDGRGLHLDSIRRLAEEKHLISPGAELTAQQIAELIFCPGFSTKAMATELSGRGVGMDAIREAFSQAGGSIQLELLNTGRDLQGCVSFRIRGILPSLYFATTEAKPHRAAS